MRTPKETYAEFKIMPNLQLHQLRVAAVGKLVCDNFKEPVNTNDVVHACLFHDMGNIIKSELERFPEFMQPEGQPHWEKVKGEYIQKYGNDAHTANVAIARELGLSQAIQSLIDGVGFSSIEKTVAGDSNELKILEYADTRVGPHGVLSVSERLSEARARYVARIKEKAYYETDENFGRLSSAALALEKQLFEKEAIKPENITDATIAALVDELWEYPVNT